ncbi:(E3-independent) E2 ubiquitin-conjugating enzyme UBE2O isoform X1 [Hetaerina americana]|uniref:(E3-independent) E2 ubiquitin-conjugating enzyme UBE2O isoform X1 n=1 Tax=Hetaerina americana TaxID=62018 RepID=UPI003A7F5810
MAAEYQYFYEDEVYRINKRGNVEFGMVLENAELVSGDENSDVEEGGRMKKGHIRVAWHPKGVEEVIPERKVGLADRSLMPGDVVRRMIKGKDTQRGYCRNINVLASVQIVGSKQVIINVKSADLTPLEEFSADIAVCLDSWVGGVKSVHSKIYLQWPDGSRCVLDDLDAGRLDDVEEKKEKVADSEFQNGEFYPGQTLCGPMNCLAEAKWVSCTKEMKALRQKSNKNVRAVVEQVKVDSVGVHWQCRAYSKDGACLEKEQPKFLVQGEDLKKLKLLNVFEPCTLQVGDRNYYTFQEGDVIMMKDQWRRIQRDFMLSVGNSPLRPKPNLKQLQSDRKGPQLWPADSNEVSAADSNGTTSISRSAIPPIPLQNHHTTSVSSSPVPLVVVDGGVGADGNNSDQCEDNDSDETASQSDTASASSGCSTGSFGKKKKGPALMTKVLKKKKLRRVKKRAPMVVVKPGDRLVVETLSTTSKADVVWQDGSVEHGIPSTQLYPIHHLDDQEFFPGDFVIESKEDSSMRVYGVVQSVDHAGRTARVKWFRTYTSTDEPQPKFLEENEVSVYDLKDHPDFQYRPGTVVIRVANFEGEDANCTGGQVLDNYPEGRVQVWWVDGHVSMCWPQDLYKVGEYDSDEGELWDDGSSDASWETESEDCFIADVSCTEEDMDEELKPKLASNIEKARIAMSRLEEIFTQNPSLQTTGVMRQLLEVYKDCRYLDKLMGTSFFHESHFQGLLERVRERGRVNAAQRVADQVSRLFHSSQNDSGEADSTSKSKTSEEAKGDDVHLRSWASVVKFGAEDNTLPPPTPEGSESLPTPSPDVNASAGPISVDDSGLFSISAKDSAGSSSAGESFASGEFLLSENLASLERRVTTAAINVRNLEETTTSSSTPTVGETIEQVASRERTTSGSVGGRPSSVRGSGGARAVSEEEVNSSHVCVRLCSLIKAQLVRAHAEVTKRFGGRRVRFSEVEMIVDSPENGEEANDEGDEGEEGERAMQPDATKTGKKEDVEEMSKACNGDVDAEVAESQEALKNAVPTTTAKRKAAEPPPLPIDTVEEGTEKQGGSMEGFSIVENAPDSHKFKLTMFLPTDSKSFFKTVRKELKLLRNSLPSGIWVKGFEDRMDLYSVMIRGPEKTPYEDGLFFFDFQLSADYPKAPPVCHYISYCSDRLNPNLYEDGKVCVSLLGTWSGKGTEVWTSNSNLLQVIVSIQGLILVSEPYFNEAGYEKQKGSQQGKENSRMYNEMVVLKQVQALTKIILNPPPVFKEEIFEHFQLHAYKLMNRLETWLQISERYNNSHPLSPTTPTSFRELHGEAISSAINVQLPEFPLIPASKGFCLTLRKTLVSFREVLTSLGISDKTNGEEPRVVAPAHIGNEQQQLTSKPVEEKDRFKS